MTVDKGLRNATGEAKPMEDGYLYVLPILH